MALAHNGPWTADEIRNLVATNDNAVVRGIMALYDRQTADERNAESTIHRNGMGFNGLDAGFGCSLAKQYNDRGFLTGKQITAARKMLKKYAGQLTIISNEQCIDECAALIMASGDRIIGAIAEGRA